MTSKHPRHGGESAWVDSAAFQTSTRAWDPHPRAQRGKERRGWDGASRSAGPAWVPNTLPSDFFAPKITSPPPHAWAARCRCPPARPSPKTPPVTSLPACPLGDFEVISLFLLVFLPKQRGETPGLLLPAWFSGFHHALPACGAAALGFSRAVPGGGCSGSRLRPPCVPAAGCAGMIERKKKNKNLSLG